MRRTSSMTDSSMTGSSAAAFAKRKSCFNQAVNLEAEVAALQTRVAALEAQMQALLEHLGVSDSPSDALERQVIEFIRADRVIEAVKLYRERTGLGLAAAKDAVDNLRRLHG